MAEKEYIDRDMYYQKIDDLSNGGCGDYALYRLAINDCVNVLDEMPAADVAPVRHGHWEQVDDTKCKCSECEVITMIAQYPIGADKNYCPNCGAKMDGERKENDNDT